MQYLCCGCLCLNDTKRHTEVLIEKPKLHKTPSKTQINPLQGQGETREGQGVDSLHRSSPSRKSSGPGLSSSVSPSSTASTSTSSAGVGVATRSHGQQQKARPASTQLLSPKVNSLGSNGNSNSGTMNPLSGIKNGTDTNQNDGVGNKKSDNHKFGEDPTSKSSHPTTTASKHPTQLPTSLTKWEQSLREYHEAEERVVDKYRENGNISADTLKELRNNPEAFLGADQPSYLQELAAMRVEVKSLQTKFLKEGSHGVRRFTEPMAFMATITEKVLSPASSQTATTSPPAMRRETTKNSPADYDRAAAVKSQHYPKSVVRRATNPVDMVLSNIDDPDLLRRSGASELERSSSEGDRLTGLSGISNMSSSSSGSAATTNTGGTTGTAHRISKAWAGRLASVVRLQGTVTQEETVLRIKPKWPDWLIDETFDVIKVNKYGKKYNRKLILTEYHILGAEKDRGVTKVYTYLDVERVLLSNDGQSVTVSFSNDKRTFYYLTPFAAHIAQQIATRVQVRMALENAIFSINPPSLGYSSEKLLDIISAISDESANSNSSNFLSFAKTLKNRVLPAVEDTSIVVEGEGDRKRTLSVDEVTAAARIASAKLDAELRERRLMTIEQGTSEFFVQAAVRTTLYDPSTPEGSTRKHFLETTVNPTKNTLMDIRMWVDGMHEYMFKRRGEELAKLYFSKGSSVDSPEKGSDRGGTGSGNGSGGVIVGGTASNESGLSQIDEEVLIVISFIIFTVVEESIFIPLLPVMLKHVNTPDHLEREAKIERNIEEMRGRSQRDFNIPEDIISALDWRAAIFELEGVERNPTPSTRLNAIVRAAKAIYAEFNREVKPRLEKAGKSDLVLGADDLVPIFIFVLCNSNLSHPLLNKEILWGLCDPDQLKSECGYYLTVYESAVAFLEGGGTGNTI